MAEALLSRVASVCVWQRRSGHRVPLCFEREHLGNVSLG